LHQTAPARDDERPLVNANVSRTEMPADIDEPIEIVSYDERWPDWYAHDAAEVRRVIGGRLLAIEHFGSTAVIGMWRDNLAFRDYLRTHAEAAALYAHTKERAWADGARALLQYSEFKRTHVAAVLAETKKWQGGKQPCTCRRAA
jgi:GrpB-like predicted nucleotidyltransferase (UPF0157 family)